MENTSLNCNLLTKCNVTHFSCEFTVLGIGIDCKKDYLKRQININLPQEGKGF